LEGIKSELSFGAAALWLIAATLLVFCFWGEPDIHGLLMKYLEVGIEEMNLWIEEEAPEIFAEPPIIELPPADTTYSARRITMRNMSFSMTTPQVLDETKDVTRRLGWADLEPGEHLMAIEKGQGLKKGEKVRRLKEIEIVSTRWEPLLDVTDEEVVREGFPGMSRIEFIKRFCRLNGCLSITPVNRIEFRYV